MSKKTPEFVAEDLNGSRKQLYRKLTRSKNKGTNATFVSEELLHLDE